MLVLALFTLTVTVRGHRLDEYLQATLVDIETNGITLQINLTPGVAIADAVLEPIDPNHDGEISTVEADGYADRVRSEVSLRLDDRPLTARVTSIRFPPLTELRHGLGAIYLELRAAFPLVAGVHELKFHNRHQPDRSVYLVNALIPRSREIQVTQQIRDTTQSESRIQFAYAATATLKKVTARRSLHELGLPEILGSIVLIATIAAVSWGSLRRRSQPLS